MTYNLNPNPPDLFFVPPAYPQSAITYLEVPTMLTDPYCQAFIEAMAAILVHLSQQQREAPPNEHRKPQ